MAHEKKLPMDEAVKQLEHVSPYLLHSRIHPLRGFGKDVFIKRDDELSFGISGTKLRKLASLVDYWKQSGVEFIEAIGGSHSNHLVATAQAANEHGIDLRLHLLESHGSCIANGNEAFLRLLTEGSSINWIKRADWTNQQAEFFHKSSIPYIKGQPYYMNEGGVNKEALLGAMTLGRDIINCKKRVYDHIVMDAGTGFSAAAICLYLGSMGYGGTVHVVCMAANLNFEDVLVQVCHWAEQLGLIFKDIAHYKTYPSATAKSFGAVNRSVFDEVKRMALENGVIADPIYSAKLFLTARTLLPQLSGGNVLLVHSGGALSLTGFWGHLLPDR